MALRRLAHRLLPPIVVDAARNVVHRVVPPRDRFEKVGTAWPTVTGVNPGWEDASIPRSQAERWEAFCDMCAGTAPLDVSHEAKERTVRHMAMHNTYMNFGYVLGLAAREQGEVSILDWGGGLGHYAIVAKALLPETTIDYHCKDLPSFCDRGRTLLPGAHFYEDDSCLARRYDLVIASGSLQCSPDWKQVAAGLASATGRYLYITRLPIFPSSPSVVVRQRARSQGFNDDLLGWFLNRTEFLGHLAALDMELVREFYVDERYLIHGATEQADASGFLFRPKTDSALRSQSAHTEA